MITFIHTNSLISKICYLFNKEVLGLFSGKVFPLPQFQLALCYPFFMETSGSWSASHLLPQIATLTFVWPLAPPALNHRKVEVITRSDMIDMNVTMDKLPLGLVDSLFYLRMVWWI